MKQVSVLVLCWALIGSAHSQTMTYDQLDRLSQQVNMSDCYRIDQIVNTLEDQLRRRGTFNADPENLTQADRLYNSLARIIIWNLRIGCSNTSFR